LAAGSGWAQTTNGGGGRFVFQPGQAQPVPSATPAGPPSAANPKDAVAKFFATVKEGQIAQAYDTITQNTIISARREDVSALKEKTKQAIDNYGPIAGFEIVDERTVGTCLMRLVCVSLNSDLPLRWRFYFYKSDAWRLVDIRIDDGLVELFEDAKK